jgi:hypothetical protein
MLFSLGENHEKAYRFPDFLQRSTARGQRCATFCEESRMQFGSSNDLYRKSGFGLHQLRNCFSRDARSDLQTPIGCQIYPVRASINPDFAGTMKGLPAAGFQTIELCSPFGYQPQ